MTDKIIKSCSLFQPQIVAQITICGAIHFRIDETMDFIKPTEEQIKNLHDMLCINVELIDREVREVE